jgi:hypothetical protein
MLMTKNILEQTWKIIPASDFAKALQNLPKW